jgi:ligand-binding SRPBCC domain-containing protein
MDIKFDLFPEGKTKALTMSYDDGHIHDRRLVSIFNEYGIKGTFHLNSGCLGNSCCISEDEVEKLYQGHEVSAHTKTHPFLDSIPMEAVIEEVIEDRKKLEELVCYPIKGMSYPYGVYNQRIVHMLESLGIQYSRTVSAHHGFGVPENFLTWCPTCHHDDRLMELGQKFLDYENSGKLKLMYVWGHSFEFHRNNNWSLMEDFCKLVCGNKQIWFATNVEVMRYIKALRALEFSVDRHIVYNPTDINLWIKANDKPIEAKSGELTKLA